MLHFSETDRPGDEFLNCTFDLVLVFRLFCRFARRSCRMQKQEEDLFDVECFSRKSASSKTTSPSSATTACFKTTARFLRAKVCFFISEILIDSHICSVSFVCDSALDKEVLEEAIIARLHAVCSWLSLCFNFCTLTVWLF